MHNLKLRKIKGEDLNILIIGAPASGKGTICKKLSKDYGYKHISTGDIFRAEIASGSEKGKIIASYINKGKLAPSDILIDTMREFLSKSENKDNMLLDGFGKTLEEAKELNNFYQVDKVIYLDANYDNLVGRITKRRVCPDCGLITTTDQASDGLCPDCHKELITRADDTEFVYKTRYDVFQNQTLPIVDYFDSMGKLEKIDANLLEDEVYSLISKLVKNNSKVLEKD